MLYSRGNTTARSVLQLHSIRCLAPLIAICFEALKGRAPLDEEVDRRLKRLAAAAAAEAAKAARAEAVAIRDACRTAAQPELVSATKRNRSVRWTLCDAGDRMSWSGWRGGAPAVPIFDAVAGIPAQPLTNFTAQEVRLGGHVLIEQRGWCRMHQDAAHSNSRFGEDDSYSKFCIPDTPVFTSNVTEHVPIFYWHEEQRQAAEAAGASFDILEGPSPFGGFGDGPSSCSFTRSVAELRSSRSALKL